MTKKRLVLKQLVIWLRDVSIVFLIFWMMAGLLLKPTTISGDSMQPTLQDGDQVILERLSTINNDFERYDIVVFPYPGDPDTNYIKRIIGLPGETIDIKQGQVYIDGKPLKEPVQLDTIETRGNQSFPLTIPDGRYFVMGDNRNNSSDSRYTDVGLIQDKTIVGKGWVRVYPKATYGFINTRGVAQEEQ